ncbi:MAG: serine/threonine-protein kinase [Solirubrobacterales bacterium]
MRQSTQAAKKPIVQAAGSGATGTCPPERRIRDVLDAFAVELEMFVRAGRLHDAMASASWNALKTLSRVARMIAAPRGVDPAVWLGNAAQREIARRPRYQIGEQLGSGGMAEVFRGWQIGEEGFERPVAIKRLLPKVAQNYPWLVSHEAGVLARMLHPNIVHVFDVVRDEDGQLLLVLEYVDGIHLGKLMASGPLPVSVIMFLATEILSGLGYAHHLPASGSIVHGVVHRDLSPDNILLSWDGAVKIADFGLAKERHVTEVSMSPGTEGKPGYMSPEQHLGQRLDGRSDLYSIGVLLWELLACERLYVHDRLVEQQFNRGLPPPSVFRPVPYDLEAVVMKLLRRDRKRRYRTAEVAYDAIARCDGGSLLRGRVELVELLAQRFPEQAARRRTRRPPPYPRTNATPKVTPPPNGARAGLWERSCWRMRRLRRSIRRSMQQRRREWERRRPRRLPRPWWPALAIAVACVAAVVALVVAVP